MDILTTPISGRSTAGPSSLPPRAKEDQASFDDLLTGYIEAKVKPQQANAAPGGSLILVGEITSENETVSELLLRHEELKSSAWNILSREQNLNKDYTKIQSGTRIYYNTEEGALTWSATVHNSSPGRVAPDFPRSPAVELSAQMSRADFRPETRMQIGVISENVPSVSHLLKSHSSLQSDTWNILSSAVNRDKDFTRLPVGTVVQFNYVSREISWQLPGKNCQENVTPMVPVESSITSSAIKAKYENSSGNPVLLGRIDSTNTTVSHLLKKHPQLGGNTWNILASSVNRDKPFSRIAGGTEIYVNTENMEIIWNPADPGISVSHHTPPMASGGASPDSTVQKHIDPATDLSEAVQRYLGTSYKEINCYELLVKGLQHMDIPYAGRDGLFTKLTRMALDKGMAPNAYLNGEGIVKAAGSLVLSKNYSGRANWRDEAATFIREIEPLLGKGQILSFSTRTRGHTGIVSQQNNQWTFINSGRLDNSVNVNSVRRGVGEEVLHEEIRNWFKLAHSNRENLSVTLGQLEQGKIRTASNMSKSYSERG